MSQLRYWIWLTNIPGLSLTSQLRLIRGFEGPEEVFLADREALGRVGGLNRQELDFYESQPVSRRSHFFSVWVNNLLIYLISYLSTMLLAHLVAAGLGARTEMSGTVFAESMVQALRSLLLFMGLQAVTMLAVMLTGNIVISLLAAAVLMLYEFFFRLLILLQKVRKDMRRPVALDISVLVDEEVHCIFTECPFVLGCLVINDHMRPFGESQVVKGLIYNGGGTHGKHTTQEDTVHP